MNNHSDGVMPFSVGTHLAFACNWTKGDLISDYYLEFDEEETCPYLQFNGIALSREAHKLLGGSETLQLSNNMFDIDALIFKGLNQKL